MAPMTLFPPSGPTSIRGAPRPRPAGHTPCPWRPRPPAVSLVVRVPLGPLPLLPVPSGTLAPAAPPPRRCFATASAGAPWRKPGLLSLWVQGLNGIITWPLAPTRPRLSPGPQDDGSQCCAATAKHTSRWNRGWPARLRRSRPAVRRGLVATLAWRATGGWDWVPATVRTVPAGCGGCDPAEQDRGPQGTPPTAPATTARAEAWSCHQPLQTGPQQHCAQ